MLCRVWSTAAVLDPDVVFGTTDWEGALTRAIPGVRAARKDADLARAIGSMLAELNDPATRVLAPSPKRKTKDVPLSHWEGDVLVLDVGPYSQNHSSIWVELSALSEEVKGAGALVVDLRCSGDADQAGEIDYALSELGGLTADDVAVAAQDYVMHSGFVPEVGVSSGGYFTSVVTIPGKTIDGTGGAAPGRVAFVTDSRSPLPELAVAMQLAGKAVIVSADSLGADALVVVREIELAGDWVADVRVSRPHATVRPDLVSTNPMIDAMAYARGERVFPPRSGSAVSAMPEPILRKVTIDAESEYPVVEQRILAAMRLWSTIDKFYPYRSLIDDWDAVLPEFLPHFIAAKDADEYAETVLEMMARVEDGHTFARGHPSVAKLFGTGGIDVEARFIENQLVIVEVTNESVKDLLHPGDVVLSVDGEPIAARIERMRPYVTSSTPHGRNFRLGLVAMRGVQKAEVVLEVQGADGVPRAVHVVRPAGPTRPDPAKETPYRVLDGNIGYVDLTKLVPKQVDAMFDALMKTKAIVFDMRGYPNGTAWSIAPRINTRGARAGAQFRRPMVGGAIEGSASESGYFFQQSIPRTNKPLYQGKTVTLIDERAISQAEHTCLFFEAANGTTFIGSPTTGANGDVTSVRLPGGFRVSFTGHDVRHADGRQLQRVGIQPDIPVQPTLRGIREGRDEVLERAVEYVNGL